MQKEKVKLRTSIVINKKQSVTLCNTQNWGKIGRKLTERIRTIIEAEIDNNIFIHHFIVVGDGWPRATTPRRADCAADDDARAPRGAHVECAQR